MGVAGAVGVDPSLGSGGRHGPPPSVYPVSAEFQQAFSLGSLIRPMAFRSKSRLMNCGPGRQRLRVVPVRFRVCRKRKLTTSLRRWRNRTGSGGVTLGPAVIIAQGSCSPARFYGGLIQSRQRGGIGFRRVRRRGHRLPRVVRDGRVPRFRPHQ